MNVPPSKKAKIVLAAVRGEVIGNTGGRKKIFRKACRSFQYHHTGGQGRGLHRMRNTIIPGVEIYIPLEDLI
jgi:hypothetical protein